MLTVVTFITLKVLLGYIYDMIFDLKERTKLYAINIINLSEYLPNKNVGWIIGKQIIRSSTSVAANYRAAKRSKSKKDFVYKLSIVLEEADETLFWLELIQELKIIKNENSYLNNLIKESDELISIFVSTINKLKRN